MDFGFLTAMTIGLLGSTHCIGMCGGIVGALNSGMPEKTVQSRAARIMYHLNYNAGRIFSYSVAGAVAGLAGARSSQLVIDVALPAGGLIGGLFLIGLGFYLAGWTRAISWLEKPGQYLWKFIRPIGQNFMPVKSPAHAFGLGLVWGWLPCGLVYSALALALLTASPVEGAMLMFGFGLGTLPMLLTMGRAYDFLRTFVRNPLTRRLAGVAVILLGAYTSFTAISGSGHHHSTGDGQQMQHHQS